MVFCSHPCYFMFNYETIFFTNISAVLCPRFLFPYLKNNIVNWKVIDSKHSLINHLLKAGAMCTYYTYMAQNLVTLKLFFYRTFFPDTLRWWLSIIIFRQKSWSIFYFPRSSHYEINNSSINESLIIMYKLKWYRNVCKNIRCRMFRWGWQIGFKISFKLFEKRKPYFNDTNVNN